ncbi:MauE/DoxX family redox-associated membrane protein [Salegentibacter sp. UBA1130]|uniref:MauE/DoxX family redox-associated membrane protein n=1 Tax=Salegentibacter sp. UBA1130 TaxID=1947451 RepID=UPI00257B799F|nr:MauE/DoxX family redox-associated membrane protein [Salegentibacter sp. UBA1130]
MAFKEIQLIFKTNKSPGFFLSVLVFYFILLFSFSGIVKLTDPSFVNLWLNEPFLLKEDTSTVLATGFPIIEIIIAAFIGIEKTRIVGIYFALALSVLYMGYSIWNLLNAYVMPCSCTGLIAQFSWEHYLYFNLFNLILTISFLTIIKSKKILSR